MVLSLIKLNTRPLYMLVIFKGTYWVHFGQYCNGREDKGAINEDEHFFGDGSLRNVWES
jgi:hypothetical protein